MLAPLLSTLLAAAAATAPTARAVTVQTQVPAHCLALYQDAPHGSHLLVSADTLQALAEERSDGLPLDARMVRIMAKRAKAVLAAAKDQPADAQGCQPVSLAPLHDAGYVAIPLIEASRVAVWSAQSNALAATLRIRQDSCGLDAPAGGFSATIDGEVTAFFAMITCVT